MILMVSVQNLPEALEALHGGADIVDVGGESTRPLSLYSGSEPVTEREELVRVMPVIEALETGVSITGPAGNIAIDPQTHHATLDVHIMEIEDQGMKVVETLNQVAPVDTQAVCNLQENPDDLSGWQRLARAYEVLGEMEKAKDAHARVEALAKKER